MAAPSRPNERMDKDDPISMQSRTDIEDPNLVMANTEKLLPSRAILRSDNDAPNVEKSTTENEAPKRAKLRSDTEAPK
jgi:hypothetical protein